MTVSQAGGRVVHIVIGPEQHGIVDHALWIANALGHRVVRCPSAADLRLEDLGDADVVHVAVNDYLFGDGASAAGREFDRMAALVDAAGAGLSVTLHDLPHDASPYQRERSTFYRRVVARSRGVVVNSRVELATIQDDALGAHSLRMIPLPVAEIAVPTGPPDGRPHGRRIGILGYLYPDRGYEQVIAAAPEGCEIVALGRPALGHADLPTRLAELARDRGLSWRVTGFIPGTDLPGALDAIDVPVAPNPRVTASGSINTWLAHGRRPLVPDSAYSQEIAGERPGTLTLYPGGSAAELRAAIVSALSDPDSTALAAGTRLGPDIATVAATYADHLVACRPPQRTSVSRGGAPAVVLPANRWDLLDPAPHQPSVTVVIPYYEQQRQLDLVLTALSAQQYARGRVQVVVADDGSACPPDTACAGDLDTQVVRQDDLGFRAAAARNLGAHVAEGEVLAFLDADTIPTATYLAELVAFTARAPDVLAVGRRRHADFSRWRPADVHAWFDGHRQPPQLPDPHWLADGYAATADLLHADLRTYRYVISAVLAVHRDLFREIGGFDARIVGYGGEDWDFAHRARVAGAVLAHRPAAVAWHDGTDWAGRDTPVARRAQKAREQAMLAELLPDPAGRPPGPHRFPAAVVRVPGPVSADAAGRWVTRACRTGLDCAVYLDSGGGAGSGVRRGEPSPAVTARASWLIRLPHLVPSRDLVPLLAIADRHGLVTAGDVVVQASWARHRAERWPEVDPRGMYGRHDRAMPGR